MTDVKIKATATVTLSRYRDTESVTRYYKLQTSSLAAPLKPTTNPPSSDWVKAEPACDTTKTLYFCDISVFSDGKWSASEVSKSSSYEASKEAYNKAQSAQDSANNVKDQIVSMGEQLVINGNGLMGDNTNFSALIFDASKTNGSPGSFTKKGTTYRLSVSDTYIPIIPNLRYSFEMDAISKNGLIRMYSFLLFYDVDKKDISAEHHMYIENTLTYLTQDLKNGDTVVYLNDLSAWNDTFTQKYRRGFIFWNYTNSFGYTYPELTYSRNMWYNIYENSNVDKTNNTITLSSPWSHGTFKAGTKLSQCDSGWTYKYQGMVYSRIPTEWRRYSGFYDGIDYSGKNVLTKFPPGAACAKVGFVWNYDQVDDQCWITNISLKTDYDNAIKNAQTAADNAQNNIDNLEVGGRNLLLNSSFSQNLDEWTLNADVTNEFITDGKHNCIHITMDTLNVKRLISQDVLSRVDVDTEYTLSGWFKVANLVKGSSPKIMLCTELGDSYVSYGRAEITKETDWQRLKLTFTTDSNLSSATSFRIFVYLNDITADIYFCNLKLERGNKVTDWTPSTEEIDDIGDSVIRLESSIEQTAGAVVIEALSDYVRHEDVENEDGTVTEGFNSIIEALRAAITAADGRVTTEVANRTEANDGIQQQITEIRNRMDFDESGLIFKSFVDGVESPYRIRITNDEMIFYNGATEVQRFDAQGNAKIPSLVVDNSMKLGGFALMTDSSGNLNLDWIGGN